MIQNARALSGHILGFLRQPTVLKVGGALFSQTVLSISNFIVGFSVARFALKSEYGIYIILFSLMGIVGNYQNALVNTPLMVLHNPKTEEERVQLFSGLGVGQWLVFVPLAVVVLAVAGAYGIYRQDLGPFKYAAILSVVTLAFLLREFVRTVNYSRLRITILLKMDLMFVLMVAAGMWLIIVRDQVSSTTALSVLGVSYLSVAVFASIYAGEYYYSGFHSIRVAFAETWKYSKWAMVGVTGDIFKNRGYIYIVTALLGLEVLAEVSAARLFLMPVGLLVASSGRITMAKGAEIYHKSGRRRFAVFFAGITAFLLFVWIAYSLLLFVFSDTLIALLGEKYATIKIFLSAWVMYFLVYALRYPVSSALAIFKEFKAQAKFDIVGAVVTVVACFTLTIMYGGYGTILSLAAGEFSVILISLPLIIGHLTGRLEVVET